MRIIINRDKTWTNDKTIIFFLEIANRQASERYGCGQDEAKRGETRETTRRTAAEN